MRRKVCVTLSSLGAAFCVPTLIQAAFAASPANRLRCSAPDDVTVTQFSANFGHVTEGQALMTLRSFSLERRLSVVDALIQIVDIGVRPFQDGRSDQDGRTLDEVASLYQEAAHSQKLIFAIAQNDYQNNQTPGTDLYTPFQQATRDSATADLQYQDALLASNEYKRKTKESLDRLTTAKARLGEVKNALLEVTAHLSVKAPRDGIWIPAVGLGGFAKKGDLLGEIA